MVRTCGVLVMGSLVIANLGARRAVANPSDETGSAQPTAAQAKHRPHPGTRKSKAQEGVPAQGTAAVQPLGLTKTPRAVGPEYDKAVHKALQPALNAYNRAVQLYDAGDLSGAEQAAQDSMVFAVGVPENLNPECQCLIGRIRLKQGRYAEALSWLQAGHAQGPQTDVDLDMALCYSRLGNVAAARRLYSDRFLLFYSSIRAEELPGTSTPQSLEASILLARGLQAFLTVERKQEALDDLLAAYKLAPQNGLSAFYIGRDLAFMGRGYDGEPYFQRAAKYGIGETAAHARQNALDYAHRPAH